LIQICLCCVCKHSAIFVIDYLTLQVSWEDLGLSDSLVRVWHAHPWSWFSSAQCMRVEVLHFTLLCIPCLVSHSVWHVLCLPMHVLAVQRICSLSHNYVYRLLLLICVLALAMCRLLLVI